MRWFRGGIRSSPFANFGLDFFCIDVIKNKMAFQQLAPVDVGGNISDFQGAQFAFRISDRREARRPEIRSLPGQRFELAVGTDRPAHLFGQPVTERIALDEEMEPYPGCEENQDEQCSEKDQKSFHARR